MMSDTNAILEQLDWKTVTCQCELQGCIAAGGCDQPATEQVAFHKIDRCNDPDTDPFGNYVFLLCMPCLHKLAKITAMRIGAWNMFGRRTCTSCGAPACVLGDIIREITTL